ncbi:MAG: phosphoribosylaminoimidazolesuccinocarboxamide synthase [Candidatus Omnitrophota bacterium]
MLNRANLKQLKLFKKGKVRDIYDLGDKLLIIASDRISCFDIILPTPIPDKGKILTEISLFWFSFLKSIVENHFISSDINSLPQELKDNSAGIEGRFMVVKKCEVIPFECVVRGYLSGSGWKEYNKSGGICGIDLPENLKESAKLPSPIFTPAAKADSGHDENISFNYMKNSIGRELAEKMKNLSLTIYNKAAEYAKEKGVIIADTKFEFGLWEDRIILIDEVLTPDSSRFWPKESYTPGQPQLSFDKQFVRDYLETQPWDKTPPGPDLPEEIVNKTKEKYQQALKLLAG